MDHLPRLSLRHIEVFDAVYRHGTVSAAARSLGITQPTASQVLGHAEALLGFPLFVRARGRLSPTEDAHRLFARAQAIGEQVELFRALGANLKAGRGTQLSVTALPVLGLGLVPSAVARFLARHPDVYFDLHTCHHDEIARRLAVGDAEVVLAFQALAGAPVITRPLGHGRLGLLAPGSAPRRDDARWEEVIGRPFISVARSGPLGTRIADALAERGIVPDEVASARTFHVASALVRAGVGVAIVDSFTAGTAQAEGLSFAPLVPEVAVDVVALHRPDRPPSHQMTAFLDVLAGLLSDR